MNISVSLKNQLGLNFSFHFSDINECKSGKHDCHRNAICENNPGSFSCECRIGFKQFRNGRLCLKEDEEEKGRLKLFSGSLFSSIMHFKDFVLYFRTRAERVLCSYWVAYSRCSGYCRARVLFTLEVSHVFNDMLKMQHDQWRWFWQKF